MYNILIFVSTVVAIFLIIMVLLQSSKGGGLAGTFGGGQVGSMFGTRRTADFLSRATWWLGGGLAVLALSINLFFLPGKTTVDQRESIIQKGGRQNVPQTGTMPQNTPPQNKAPQK